MSENNLKTRLFTKSEVNSTGVFTVFSLLHVASGWYLAVLFNYIGLNNIQNIVAVNALSVLYELKDYYVTYHTVAGQSGKVRNTLVNSIGDHFSTIIGAIMFYYVNKGKVSGRVLIINTIVIFVLYAIFSYIIWGYYKVG